MKKIKDLNIKYNSLKTKISKLDKIILIFKNKRSFKEIKKLSDNDTSLTIL